jgi:tetratricopeptide (TPR) repeat protein
MMFRGALLSMDALQAKYESQKTEDSGVKQQKSGEAQNLFFQSRAYYRRAIGYNKNYSPAWNSMGTTYYLQEIPKAAIPCYRKAISINENYSSAWFNLGKAYAMISMTDSAAYSYRQSIRSDSTFIQAYQELSRLIMTNEKDSAAALKLLRLSTYYAPSSEVPWVSMSVIYFSYNDSAKAIISLEKAAQIYPGDVNRLQLLSTYFQNHNDPKKADYYLKLLAIEKKKMEIPADKNPD